MKKRRAERRKHIGDRSRRKSIQRLRKWPDGPQIGRPQKAPAFENRAV